MGEKMCHLSEEGQETDMVQLNCRLENQELTVSKMAFFSCKLGL